MANCCPGLEVDFRAVWRRMFEGLELREYDNLIVRADGPLARLARHRLLAVRLPDAPAETALVPVMNQIRGQPPSDPEQEMLLTTSANPFGLAPLEWSNALARVLAGYQGREVECLVSTEVAETAPAAGRGAAELRGAAPSRAGLLRAGHRGDRRGAGAGGRADAGPVLAVAERLPRVLVLLLGLGAAGLRQRRARAGRPLRRRQLAAEAAHRALRAGRLRRRAAGVLRRPLRRLGEVAALPGRRARPADGEAP